MFCEKCGKELYEGAKFCSGCGAVIEGSKESSALGSDNPPREYGIEGFYHRDN